MTSYNGGPFNLVAGSQLSLVPPNWTYTDQSFNVVVYNSTQFQCQCSGDQGTKWLYGFNADNLKGQLGNLTVYPLVPPTTPAGCYLGIVTTTSFDGNSEEPTGFPLPLSPFPGGYSTLAYQVLATAGFVSPNGILVAIPPGTLSVTVSGLALGTSVTVEGYQTGENYGTETASSSGVVTINLSDNIQDTILAVFVSVNSTITVVANSSFIFSTGGADLLGNTQYAPGTQAPYTISATTLTAVDATNLTVNFTAPASGNVLVKLSTMVVSTNVTAGSDLVFGLINQATAGKVGTEATAMFQQGTADEAGVVITTTHKITGLTPGTAYTLQWGAYLGSAGHGFTLYVGDRTTAAVPSAPATMEVYQL